MDWMNWNRYQLEWIHLHWVRIHIQNDWIENSIWRIVYHYENYQLIDIHSQIIIHLNWIIFLIWNRLWLVLLHLHTTSTLLNQLNWMIFLLLNQLNLVVVHSILFMILYWVVWFDLISILIRFDSIEINSFWFTFHVWRFKWWSKG